MTDIADLIDRLRKIAATPPQEHGLWDCTIAAWAADLIESQPQAAQAAVRAERERCAKIAETYGRGGIDYDLEPEAAVASAVAAKIIASSIRSPIPPR